MGVSVECVESCVARYRHDHRSLNFTSQDLKNKAKCFNSYTAVTVSGVCKTEKRPT